MEETLDINDIAYIANQEFRIICACIATQNNKKLPISQHNALGVTIH